jgi:translation initiation factor SUI1
MTSIASKNMNLADMTSNIHTTFDDSLDSLLHTDRRPVHISLQRRNNRKCITILQGLPDDLDDLRINKALRKVLKCNSCIKTDEQFGRILQFQGDHRIEIKQFLIAQELCSAGDVIVSGA